MIVGQNSLLNQYVPTFFIKNLVDGQMLAYDSVKKAFVNVDASASGGDGATRLGQLMDVSTTVDNPLSVQNGQALTYNSFTSLWENKFTDYNTLLNKPTSSSFSFSGLSDTATPSLPDGYVKWNSTGTQLVYSTTIPAASITGLAQVATTGDYNNLINRPTNIGSVTSVALSGGTTGLTTTGSPITTAGVISLAGTLNIANGGTGATSAISAFTSLAPAQTGNGGKVLSTDGTSAFWTTISNTAGTVTSVDAFGAAGVIVTGGPVTSSGQFTIGLGAITPTSVAATGTVTGSNISGTNTGDQTIVLSGDAFGTGTGSISLTLAEVNTAPQVDAFRRITVNSKGLTTGTSAVLPADITSVLGYTPYSATNPDGYTANTGTVTNFTFVDANGISGNVSNSSTSPSLTVSLGSITPTSVAATGTVTGSNISGTNTGDQTITLTGDITGSGTGEFVTTLSNVNLTVGTFGSSLEVPVITVDSKGRITSVSTNTISTGGVGTVTSVSATGANGIEVSGSPITSSGIIALSLGAITPTSVAATGLVTGSNISGTNTGDQTITLTGDVTGSGTGSFGVTLATVNASPQIDAFRRITVNDKGLTTGTSAVLPADITSVLGFTPYNATNPDGYTSNTGTVTSVSISGGTTGLTTTGGPVTTDGTITLAGTLAVANGGTGATTAAGAINALVPTQTGNAGMFLTTDGSVISWANIPASGTVTSVGATGTNGITISGSPVTSSGIIVIGLDDITPTSVAATGTVTGSNISGTNTGDQTIALTGDVTGSGTGSFGATLATVNTDVGTYGNAHFVPTITVNNKGLVTSVTTQHVDTSVRDLIDAEDTLVIAPRHQYILTGRLEVLGRIENNGRIAIL